MNWKQYVETQNAKTYQMPAGWTPQDKIAKQLGCSPDRVNERLRPSINAREVEVKPFSVWDRPTKRIVRVFGYRTIAKKPATQPAKK